MRHGASARVPDSQCNSDNCGVAHRRGVPYRSKSGAGVNLRVLFGAIGNHIVTVDQGTGKAEALGTTQSCSGLKALTYDANPGTMFGIVDGVTNSKLARIDRTSGQATSSELGKVVPFDGPKRHLSPRITARAMRPRT